MQGKGQATVEVLALVGVLFAMAIVISVFMVSPDSSEKKYGQSNIYWSVAKPISVSGAKAVRNGMAIDVRNGGEARLSITSVTVANPLTNSKNSTIFSPSIALEPGAVKKISFPAAYPSGLKYCEMGLRFDFESSGVEKSQIGKTDLVVPCSPSCSGLGEYCGANSDCCTGKCNIGSPSACACSNLGQACASSGECCNNRCGKVASGKTACCSIANESCSSNSDCCLGFECGGDGKCFAPAPNLVPEARNYSDAMMFGTGQAVSIATMNVGTGPGGNSSVTRVVWDGSQIASLSVPSLGAGAENAQSVNISCTGSGTKTLEINADYDSSVNESNEADNSETYAIGCSCPVCPYTSAVDFTKVDSGHANWVGFRSYDLNITTSDAFLAALWFNDIEYIDYGPAYLNNNLIFQDSAPSPNATTPCSNNLFGPVYADPSAINGGLDAVNLLHFDMVDFCGGKVGFSLTMGYNISMIPTNGSSCACPPSASGYFNVSELYHRQLCTVETEFSSECPSGICAWDPSPACTVCKSFPSGCASDSDCCNSRCINFNGNGTMRCAYSPVKRGGSCDANYTQAAGMCVPGCSGPSGCPSPLECYSGGCRLGCATGSDCGSAGGYGATECNGGYCEYP